MMACPEPPTPEVMPAEPEDDVSKVMPSGADTTSGAISISFDLSTVVAFLSFLGAAMT